MPAANATLIDTGPLVAALAESDARHEECEAAFKELPAPLLTCWPVITEAAYLLGESTRPGRILFELVRTNALDLLRLDRTDLNGIEAILLKYQDQGFQLADACLMYLAEREGIIQVLTLDKKDFGLYRTAEGKALTLLP